MRRIHRHVTYGNVVATFALFLALGGSAYAVAGNPFVGRDGSISGCVKRSDGVLSVGEAVPTRHDRDHVQRERAAG